MLRALKRAHQLDPNSAEKSARYIRALEKILDRSAVDQVILAFCRGIAGLFDPWGLNFGACECLMGLAGLCFGNNFVDQLEDLMGVEEGSFFIPEGAVSDFAKLLNSSNFMCPHDDTCECEQEGQGPCQAEDLIDGNWVACKCVGCHVVPDVDDTGIRKLSNRVARLCIHHSYLSTPNRCEYNNMRIIGWT